MSEIMTEVSERFGPRDDRFFFIGWEFFGESPKLIFPSSGSRHVMIRLSMSASERWSTAVHELAHECVHLLCPIFGDQVSTLEEGVASWYSFDFYRRTTGLGGGDVDTDYRPAHGAVMQLFAEAADGPQVIRRLREEYSCFSDITSEAILRAVPSFDPHLADFLVSHWSRADTPQGFGIQAIT